MSTFTVLFQTLNSWIRRMRLQRALTWSLRGLAIGLCLALAVGLLGLLGARLLRLEFLALVTLIALSASLLAGIVAYLWPVQPLQAARRFDRLFLLEERVSTALELNQGQAQSGILVTQQLEDAVAASKRVQPKRDLPLRVKRLEGLLALVFVLLIGLVWSRGESFFQAAARARAVQQAVDAQAQQIEEILKQIETNQALTEEQKRALSQPLEQALQDLQANPSQEGAVSILASAGEKLRALSDPQADKISQALQQAGEKLAAQEGSPLESVGKELVQGDALNAAAQLAQIDVSQLSQAEREQLADQLESTAQSLQSTNPQLASQLNQAAQALRSGDTAAAQEALQQAAQSLAQTGQQLTFSQTAEQAASQMQQGAGQVLAAGGGQQTAQAGTDPGGQNNGADGSGTGSGEADDSGAGEEAGSAPIPQNNGAGDGGQSGYEQIFAPTRVEGEEGETVDLPPSGEDGSTTGTGPTTPSDPGDGLVPYNEVFAQYEAAIQQAIESGQVPFEFIQIILNYFNSLTP